MMAQMGVKGQGNLYPTSRKETFLSFKESMGWKSAHYELSAFLPVLPKADDEPLAECLLSQWHDSQHEIKHVFCFDTFLT